MKPFHLVFIIILSHFSGIRSPYNYNKLIIETQSMASSLETIIWEKTIQ